MPPPGSVQFGCPRADVAFEAVSCADTLQAKHPSNASLRHISRYRLPSYGHDRDVVVLAELLRCLGDVGRRFRSKFLCPLEAKQVSLAVSGFNYAVRDPKNTVIRLKLDSHFFP